MKICLGSVLSLLFCYLFLNEIANYVTLTVMEYLGLLISMSCTALLFTLNSEVLRDEA